MKNLKDIIIIAAALSVVSCSYVSIEGAGLEELGVYENSYEIPEHEGILDIRLIANGPASIVKLADDNWLSLSTDRFDADCTVRAAYQANDGFPRFTKLLVSLDGNPVDASDTITICQRGLKTPYVRLPKSALLVNNDEEGDNLTEVEIDTNIPTEDIVIEKRTFEGGDEWLKDVRWNADASSLEIVTQDNEAESRRTAVVSFSYDTGWGESERVDLRITQTGCNGDIGTVKTFEELRQMATVEGVMLYDGFCIEAHVVSDVNSGNVNENPRQTVSVIDYDVCRKSAYIQSLDGKYGFLMTTLSDKDNVFVAESEVLISLSGVTLKKQLDPERYILEGVSASSLLTSELTQIPEKEKYISELTPEDIYTRVTLKDVEWPVRKGSLSPTFERMTNAADVNSATKFATLLRDVRGNSMYVYTNSTCNYRRDGSKMPYGSGKMRGVIVHEKHRCFIDEDAAVPEECGNIGMYQIRHNSREDFMMAEDFRSGFSEMICEFRYIDKDSDGKMKATYGSGTMTHSSSYESYYDFSYLGPVGIDDSFYFGKHFGNENGFGITLESGEEFGMDITDVNKDKSNAGRTGKTQNLAWASSYWWEKATEDKPEGPHYWQVEFSTAGISTDVLSLQISMLNQGNTADHRAPRYWKIEWASEDEGVLSEWHGFDGNEFVVPDITPTSGLLIMSMSSAFKPMDFRLPAAMLGHEKVIMRIGPASNNAGSPKPSGEGGPVYQGETISSKVYGGGSMNYLAIRYNK